MAHELSFNKSGLAEMAYAGLTPWHGLGQYVSPDASLEEWMKEAKMEWEIKRAPVQYMNGEIHEFPEHHVLYRSDTNAPLSVVGNNYKIVQPIKMIEFFRSLVEQEGFSIETIGALKGGRRIWALAKTNIENDVMGSDRLKGYLLLVTTCDGTLATTAKFTSVRVVCWNTQSIALSEQGAQVKVRHNCVFDPHKVKGQLGLIGSSAFDKFLGNMRGLTKVKVSETDARQILTTVLPVPTGLKKVEETFGFQKILHLFNGGAMGSHLPGNQGTAWGLLNAVTEYSDHHARAHSAENRLYSQWFGVNANLKEATEDLLCEMII